jgi:selenide,water dikinase
LGPGALTEILQDLPNVKDRDLLVGYDSSDDAAVYRVSDDVAVIETVDFFTPIVDDPYLFGQIAAANALSDVYAMGGEPRVAMNLLCVPNCLPKEDVRAILEGGHSKAVEAGCVIAGGHTIQDNEPKYGLCVTGFVHPERILKNVGAQPGDVLVLTKPIGSGVLTTALKADLISASSRDAAYAHMATLNKAAGDAVRQVSDVHACTDITGFGLLGHSFEMAEGSGVTIRLHGKALPLMDEALDMAGMGIIPSGAYRNMDYVKPHLAVLPSAQQALLDLAADPQTSGGLLVALPREQAERLLSLLRPFAPWSAIVGEVSARKASELEFD